MKNTYTVKFALYGKTEKTFTIKARDIYELNANIEYIIDNVLNIRNRFNVEYTVI
jgi:hypothetical protein